MFHRRRLLKFNCFALLSVFLEERSFGWAIFARSLMTIYDQPFISYMAFLARALCDLVTFDLRTMHELVVTHDKTNLHVNVGHYEAFLY